MCDQSGIDVRPGLRFLDDRGVDALHSAALRILEKTGVLVHHPEVVEMLVSAGCRVGRPETVHVPGELVEQAIESAPESVAISNRAGEPAMLLEDRRSYWGTGSDTPFVLDSFTNERRPTCLKDIESVSRLVDGLDNFDFLMCMGVAHELPQTVADKHHFAAMVASTIKPLVFTAASTAYPDRHTSAARSEPDTIRRCRTVKKMARSTSNSYLRPANRSLMICWMWSCCHRRSKTSGGPILMVSAAGKAPRLWASMTATLSAKRAQEDSRASILPVPRKTSSRPRVAMTCCRTSPSIL